MGMGYIWEGVFLGAMMGLTICNVGVFVSLDKKR